MLYVSAPSLIEPPRGFPAQDSISTRDGLCKASAALGRELLHKQEILGKRLFSAKTESETVVWNLVAKYFALHKLFCIAHAYWHRGYTTGRRVVSDHVTLENQRNDDFFLPGNVAQQDRFQLTRSSDVPMNPDSLRLFLQAYELHSLRKKPDARRSEFPILVLCDAIKTGVQPSTDFALDTYDMTITLDGQKVQL